jgi:membrane associated rhomboid family serine protease
MTDPAMHPLETILRCIAAASPEPWYPAIHAKETGTPRDTLDCHLDQLRMGGLIHLTDWVQGRGQGYALTQEGKRVVQSQRELSRLQSGQLPVASGGSNGAARPADRGMTTWERGEMVREAVLSPHRSGVIGALILINVVVFLVGLFIARQRNVSPETYLAGGVGGLDPHDQNKRQEQESYYQVLVDTGAANGECIVRGQWWRLLTYAFVHGGLLHLGVNMLGLFLLGRVVEQMWGPLRFLALYFLAALGGGCAALVVQPAGIVGASGALCGVLASAGVWILLNRRHLPGRVIYAWLQTLVVNSVLVIGISAIPGVSAPGHYGGAAVGVAAGVLLNYQRFGTRAQRWPALIGLFAVPVICVGLVARAMAGDDPRWRHILLTEKAREQAEEAREQSRRLKERLLPQAQQAEESADAAYRDQALPLLRQDAGHRAPEAVAEAVTALKREQARLTEAADVLGKEAGSSATRDVNRVREFRARHLREKARLFELIARRLEKGDAWNGEDVVELEQRRGLVRQLDRQWRDGFSDFANGQ